MGYYFATKNTAYVVKSLPNPNTVLLSGGPFDNHEVYAPKGLVGEGVRFESAITNNMANGSYRGQSFHTSTIQAIHSFPESEDQKMQNLRVLEAKERMMQNKINNQVNRASRLYSGSNVSNDYQFGDN